jgi:coenzyme PQQ precursor peptide PqqA
MPWTKPDFVEVTLNMEVTAYVNTDDKAGVRGQEPGVREESESASPKSDQ